MPAETLQPLVDRFVALSLLIDEELLGSEIEGLQELFDQRQKCLDQLQSSIQDGSDLSVEQKRLLAQQDEYTRTVIARLQGELRNDIGKQNLQRQSRHVYRNGKVPRYELTG